MTGAAVVAAVLSGVSALAAGDARQVARLRVRRLSSSDASHRPRPGVGLATARVALAGVAAAMVVLPVTVRSTGIGPVLAGLAPALLLLTQRRRAARSAARRHQREVASALPRFADLVAACLEAGAAPADAVDVVRRHLVGPLADRLAPVVGALRSGVDPLRLYGDHGRDDPARGLVAALARAMETGAPLADTVAAVADDQRRRRRWSAEAAAHRAGVHAIGPLVVCFLPAFVLLGVVPVVVGIAAEVLGDLS
jgi:pilus assembly protein TadC